MSRRRLALAALASAAALAALASLSLLVTSLLDTTVPGGLRPATVELHRFFTQPQLDRARSYNRFVYIDELLSQFALLGALVVYARRGERLQTQSAAGRIGTGMMLAMLGFAVVWIAQLPFGVAELWWARRHHVLHDGYVSFVLGNFFALGGKFLFVCVAILIVMALARPLRRLWWVAAVPVFGALALLQAFVSPFLLANTHRLNGPVLAAQAATLQVQDGLSGVIVDVQAVRGESKQPNAEAVGLGPTRRVVLWDTLLDGRFSTREVRAVLAHELAHHKRDHIFKGVLWYALLAIPVALAVALATRSRGGMFEPSAVPVALLVYALVQFAASPLRTAVVRNYEREADWISLQTARDPQASRALFRELALAAHADPSPPAWAQAMFEDHPTIAQRLAQVDAWQARQGGVDVAR